MKKRNKTHPEENLPSGPIGVCIGGYEFGKSHIRHVAPGQGMTINPDAFWRVLAQQCIDAAMNPAEAQGKSVTDLVAAGEDTFFTAVAAGAKIDNLHEWNKKSVFAEVVQMLSVPGYRIMYDPHGDFSSWAVPEAEARCGWHLPDCN